MNSKLNLLIKALGTLCCLGQLSRRLIMTGALVVDCKSLGRRSRGSWGRRERLLRWRRNLANRFRPCFQLPRFPKNLKMHPLMDIRPFSAESTPRLRVHGGSAVVSLRVFTPLGIRGGVRSVANTSRSCKAPRRRADRPFS
jgi:hypothetical protein